MHQHILFLTESPTTPGDILDFLLGKLLAALGFLLDDPMRCLCCFVFLTYGYIVRFVFSKTFKPNTPVKTLFSIKNVFFSFLVALLLFCPPAFVIWLISMRSGKASLGITPSFFIEHILTILLIEGFIIGIVCIIFKFVTERGKWKEALKAHADSEQHLQNILNELKPPSKKTPDTNPKEVKK